MLENVDKGKLGGRVVAAGAAALTLSSFVEYARAEDWGPLNEFFAVILVLLAAGITVANRRDSNTKEPIA